MKFTVHCLVKNEDIWVKSAIESVLPFADKVLVFDNGPSTDQTVSQIESIKSSKIKFMEKGLIEKKDLVELRLEMIKQTETSWFLILDGDEIWPEEELRRLVEAAETASSNVVALVNRNKNCVGDIYHYLPEESAHYSLVGRVGNLTIRMIKKTPDLTIKGVFPLEYFTNLNGPIQSQDENLHFVDCWYLHTSHLKRSSKDESKKSESFAKSKIWERGIKLKEEEIPEVLKKLDKNSVQLKKRGKIYEVGSTLTSPMIKLKRKLR